MFQVSTAKQSQRYSCWALLAMTIEEVGSLHSKKLKQWMGMIHIEVTLCRNCPAGKIKNKSLYAAPRLWHLRLCGFFCFVFVDKRHLGWVVLIAQVLDKPFCLKFSIPNYFLFNVPSWRMEYLWASGFQNETSECHMFCFVPFFFFFFSIKQNHPKERKKKVVIFLLISENNFLILFQNIKLISII